MREGRRSDEKPEIKEVERRARRKRRRRGVRGGAVIVRLEILCLSALIVVLMVLCLTGKEDKQPDSVKNVVREVVREDLTYQFVDVLGNQYEAELLDGVPLCGYDYSRMAEQNGYKYYMGEEGQIQSRVGIDVSKYQADIDWTKVKASGVDFVIVRLGLRGYGAEGKLTEDEKFRAHVEGALSAGLEVGVYFFSQAVSDDEALEEAQFVLERLKGYEITGPVVFDTEEIKDAEARTDGLAGEQFTENCITFCDAVEAAGYRPMIYANMKWMAFTLNLTRLTEYEKWYADYEAVPQCPYEFSIWQYTESGTVPGVEGNVDINVWFERRERR